MHVEVGMHVEVVAVGMDDIKFAYMSALASSVIALYVTFGKTDKGKIEKE